MITSEPSHFSQHFSSIIVLDGMFITILLIPSLYILYIYIFISEIFILDNNNNKYSDGYTIFLYVPGVIVTLYSPFIQTHGFHVEEGLCVKYDVEEKHKIMKTDLTEEGKGPKWIQEKQVLFYIPSGRVIGG